MCAVNDRKRTGSFEAGLKEILKKLFQVREVSDEDSIETIPLWDSMGHMELMAALEKRFNIRIESDDIINLTSVKALKKYLKERV